VVQFIWICVATLKKLASAATKMEMGLKMIWNTSSKRLENAAAKKEALKKEMGTKIWTCPRCNGHGEYECGDPHAANMVPCCRCGASGKITDLEGLREAMLISDLSALELTLQEHQSQCDLDWALHQAISRYHQDTSRYPECVRLLLAAGADGQAALNDFLGSMARQLWKVKRYPDTTLSILRLLVESGVVAGSKEMQCFHDALKCVGSDQPDTKQVLEVFREILMSASPKVLSLCMDEGCPDSWRIKVHMLDGNCVATVDVLPCSMTLRELKMEIQSQASIPSYRQQLIFGGEILTTEDAQFYPDPTEPLQLTII